MPVEPAPALRPNLRLRADIPEPESDWSTGSSKPAALLLAGLFVLVGGASLELGTVEARLGLAAGEPLGPLGRAFGRWEPSAWPLAVAPARLWAMFERDGATANAVRWPSAIAGVVIGFLLARRGRMASGPRASILVAVAWFGSLGLMDRSSTFGIDLIAGLGTVAALDRLLTVGAGWGAGCWTALAFWAGGWPPVAVVGLATIVLGRSARAWRWRLVVPVAASVAAWSIWARWNDPVAWKLALTMPLTWPSNWTLILGAILAGCPWAPFAAVIASKGVREGILPAPRTLAMGWLRVAGACLIVGSLVPGLDSAAVVPALAGLAFASGIAWDRAYEGAPRFPTGARRWLFGGALALAGLWLALVLGWGGAVAFSIAYYRAVMIGAVVLSVVAFLFALAGARRTEARQSLAGVVLIALALKLAHWGYYVPEWNYRNGAGPWGRAIGQWVPEKHPVYVLHAWPSDLAFAIGRPVRQIPTPRVIEYQPGQGSKFVLLLDTEWAESQAWPDGWPKLIKVAEFEDETGDGHRVLARTDAPLIVKRPYRPSRVE